MNVEEKDELIIVAGKVKSGLQRFSRKNYLLVLDWVIKSYISLNAQALKQNHDAKDVTMSIACSKASWIVNSKRHPHLSSMSFSHDKWSFYHL